MVALSTEHVTSRRIRSTLGLDNQECMPEFILIISAVFAGLTLVYNELHADAGFWLLRNTINGLGFAAFEAGTTLLAGEHTTTSCGDI